MKVEYVDHMGSDLSIVNAARVSFAKNSSFDEEGKIRAKDEKLLRYLADHNHWTPFGHTSITLRCEAPIPIRTQAFKHKQGLLENEESRRYIKSTPSIYIPDEFRTAPTGSAKQGSGGKHPDSDRIREKYTKRCNRMVKFYEKLIKDGVCPEQARFVLPQGCEVNWIWTGNLYAFANFVKKRTDPNAQKEIRDMAISVDKILKELYPAAYSALRGYTIDTTEKEQVNDGYEYYD